MLAVRVADAGVGIAPKHLPHLFNRFYRVADTQATKGVGLGLFICKHIAETHGDQIAVTSAPGSGTTFTFTLPTLVDAEMEETPQPVAVTSAVVAR